MIFKNGIEITGVRTPKAKTGVGLVVQAIYHGGVMIWQAIRSCFGSGFWVNTKPWLNDEGWKNK